MAYHIYSTLANGQAYTVYLPKVEEKSQAARKFKQQVVIKGGAGVASKNLITPRGVRTEITDQEYGAIADHFCFRHHVKEGFIVVEKVKANANKVARDMNDSDGSAPKTEDDFPRDSAQVAGTKKATENKI